MKKDLIITLLFVIASQGTDVIWIRFVYTICIAICTVAIMVKLYRKHKDKRKEEAEYD